MDGGQVSSEIRLQRVGARRGVAKVGYQLGHFRQCWFGSHTASGVLQMKIVPHSRERRDGFIMAALFEVKKKIPLCEVSPWRFWCWVEQATSAVMRRALCGVPAMRSCFMTISPRGFAAWRKASNLWRAT